MSLSNDALPFLRLARAMIDEAASDLLGKSWERASGHSGSIPKKTNHAISAWNWINEQSDCVFGFQFCCDLLELNPEAVREKINCQYRTITGTSQPR